MKSNPQQRLSLGASCIVAGLFVAGAAVVYSFPLLTLLAGGVGTMFYIATDPEGRLEKMASVARRGLGLGLEAGRNIAGHILSKGIDLVQKRVVHEPASPPPEARPADDPHAHVWKAATWRNLFNGLSRRVDEKLKKKPPAPGGGKPPAP